MNRSRIIVGGSNRRQRIIPVASVPTPFPTLIAEDTFNRANDTAIGNTPIGGFAWTEHGGDIQIFSNMLRPFTIGNEIGAGATFDPVVSDYAVEVDAIRDGSASNQSRSGLIVRGTDFDNCIAAYIYQFSTTQGLYLVTVVGGTATSVYTDAAYTFVLGVPVTVRVECIGDAYTLYADGVQKYTGVIPGFSGTRVGTYYRTNNTGTPHLRMMTDAIRVYA